MHLYRKQLPQMTDTLFLTDGGLETTLVFHHGLELPLFASFDLLKTQNGTERLLSYYCQYAQIAQQFGYGFILEGPTWRANQDWGARLGYDAVQLAEANRSCIRLMAEVRKEFEHTDIPMVISGCIGPRGDGYQAADFDVDSARTYHQTQLQTLADTEADMASAMTITNINEAIGIALAAKAVALPVSISFTVETDGCLPSGESLQQAIVAVDQATEYYPAYYMINCAHPSHFEHALPKGEALLRLRGVRANASRCSHAELDESPVLDDGNPEELGREYQALRRLIPNLTVIGGCCGTDHRHIESIGKAFKSKS